MKKKLAKKKKITNKTSTVSNPLAKTRTGYNEARDAQRETIIRYHNNLYQ